MPALSQEERVRREIEDKRREHAREVVLPLLRDNASLSATMVALIHDNALGDVTLADVWPDGSGRRHGRRGPKKATKKRAKKKATKKGTKKKRRTKKRAKKKATKKKGAKKTKKKGAKRRKYITRGLGDKPKQWPTKEAILWDMKKHKEPALLMEIAEPYEVSRSTISNRLFALEQEGLVEREGTAKDVRYSITAEGRKHAKGRRPKEPKG